jgi:hypothetical protein
MDGEFFYNLVRGLPILSDTPQASRLRELLALHGASGASVSAAIAWAAFKDYGREVFGPESMGLLFQVGVFDFSGQPLFYFDPVCQFEMTDDEGEHDHYEQLHCELTCPPTEMLSKTDTNLWSFNYPTADAFFAAVEALPEFQVAIQHVDYVLTVTHEDV